MTLVNNITSVSNKSLAQLIIDVAEEYIDDGCCHQTINKIIDQHRAAKAGLISLLSRHPSWDAENMSVIDDMTIKRSPSLQRQNLIDIFTELYNAICGDEGSNQSQRDSLVNLSNWFTQQQNKLYIDQEDLDNCCSIENMPTAWKPKLGQKYTRYLTGLIKSICPNQNDRIKRHYNQYTASMPQSQNYKIVLSAHPCDYLTMSNGNSWSTCQRLTGDYASGTISYMLDSVSLVCYLIPADSDGCEKYYHIPKIHRQVIYYTDGLLVQSRLYPDNTRRVLSDSIRHYLQQIFSDVNNVPNLWVINRSPCIGNYLTTCQDSGHYADYNHSGNAIISKLRGVYNDTTDMVIGSRPICICCGWDNVNSGYLTCGCTNKLDDAEYDDDDEWR